MTNSKSTKRALLSSAFAILVCVAMLIGTTFAWFSDTASIAVNKIQSGTLSVDIVDENEKSIKDKSMSFVNKEGSADILWEPGAAFKTPAFKIKSTGKLALKYKLTLNGITGDNELLKVIQFSVVDADGTEVDLDNFEGYLTPDAALSDALYIKGYMDKKADNKYQGKELIGLGITVVATQWTYEKDSKDEMYDENAEYPEVDAADLADVLNTLEDNAVISVTGRLDSSLTISKPVTIHNLTATAPVTIASNGVTLNAANIKHNVAKESALVVKSGVTDVTIINSVITAATGRTGSHTAVSLPVSGKVVFTGNTVTNNYNGIEFGQGSTELLGNGSVIADNTFKNIGNNAISIYRVAEGAAITIENNVFDHIGNAIRLSNYPTGTTATFNIKDNTVDTTYSWQNTFVLLEDTGNNDFTKYTLNFSGNTLIGANANYYKVYKDGSGIVDNNNPNTSGLN